MKVLVISTNREKSPQVPVPLGACCAASAAESAGHAVAFLDLCFERAPADAVERAAKTLQPDAIGLSIRNLDNCDYSQPHSYLPEIRSIVDSARKACSAPIIIGGPAVSQTPEAVARCLGADFAVSGEGEIAFPALLKAISNGTNTAAIPGVTTMNGANATTTPPAPISELSRIADPQPWQWLDMKHYRAYDAAMPIQTKRGCALTCSYCVYPAIEGSEWRLRDPELVADDVEYTCDAGLAKADFVDAVFGLPQDHAIACCEAIARRDTRLPLSTLGLNPAACSPELIEAMNAASFLAVGVTADSACPTMLESLEKSFTLDDLHSAVHCLSKLNAVKLWMFLVGGPGETEITLARTLRFIESLPTDNLVMVTHGIRTLPGAPLTGRLRSENAINPATDLIHPTFYYSPLLTPVRAHRMIENCSFPSSNMVTLTDCCHRLAPAVQRVASLLGAQGPYWSHLPLLNRARRFLGV